MENFNKVLSFLLGLVVVVVFIIVLSKRLNIDSKFIPFGNKTSPTPTIIQTKEETPVTKEEAKQPEIKFTQPDEQRAQTQTDTNTSNIKSIPETGPSTSILLLYSAIGIAGTYLRRYKK